MHFLAHIHAKDTNFRFHTHTHSTDMHRQMDMHRYRWMHIEYHFHILHFVCHTCQRYKFYIWHGTCTHMCTDTSMQVHTDTWIQTYRSACADIYRHMHIYLQTQTHIHIHICTKMCTWEIQGNCSFQSTFKPELAKSVTLKLLL